MKKGFRKIMAMALTVALLTSCTSGKDSSANVNPQTGEEKVNLKFSVWDKDSSVRWQLWADSYMDQNPNVNIELVDLGSTDYSTVLTTQLAGGSGDIDVIAIKDIPGYSNLISLGMLEPLNDYAMGAGIDTSMYNGAVEQLTSEDGNFYAIPALSDYWLLYYNKDLFDAAGVDYPTNDMTFEEYDALARKVTYGTGNDKVYGDHFHTWRSTVQLFGTLDGVHNLVDGNYDFLKPYYEIALKQQADKITMDYATLKTSSTHYSGVFYNNQVAMMHMGSWFISTQIEKVKSGESLSKNWGLVKYPHPTGVEAGTTAGSLMSIAVNSKSDNKEEALDFLKFVTGKEGSELSASIGQFPAYMTDETLETLSSVDGFPSDENSKEALKVTKLFLEMPLSVHSADIEVALNEIHDNIMTENISIDDGIKEMNKRVGNIINK